MAWVTRTDRSPAHVIHDKQQNRWARRADLRSQWGQWRGWWHWRQRPFAAAASAWVPLLALFLRSGQRTVGLELTPVLLHAAQACLGFVRHVRGPAELLDLRLAASALRAARRRRCWHRDRQHRDRRRQSERAALADEWECSGAALPHPTELSLLFRGSGSVSDGGTGRSKFS
eukprot:SAG31_NODE_46_length_30980_cov_226.095107_14_plen_173_part_00